MQPDRLARSLQEAPILRTGGYDYFVHPLTDGIPQIDPALLNEAIDALHPRLPAAFDKILTAEAMGIPLAAALSLRTGRPFSVARKRRYGLPGEIVVAQKTGYSEANLHVHGLQRGERVLLLDDVVSTGGTLRALAAACRTAQATPVKALLLVDKHPDVRELGRELALPLEALVRLRITAGRIHLET